MGKHTANKSRSKRLAGGAVLSAAAASMAAAAMSGGGVANASCASISGVNAGGNSGGSTCISTPGPSFAVGIGDNTDATAVGFFSGAIAFSPENGAADQTTATTLGNGSIAIAAGRNTNALTIGNFSASVAQGVGASPDNPVTAIAGLTPADNGNFSFNVLSSSAGNSQFLGAPIPLPAPLPPLNKAPTSMTLAAGQGNVAANLGGVQNQVQNGPLVLNTTVRPMRVQAVGIGNAAFNIGGAGNTVSAGQVIAAPAEILPSPTLDQLAIPLPIPSTGGLAFNALGSNNDVLAVGPFAVAGALAVSDHKFNGALGGNPVVQLGPGVNIRTPLNP